MTIFFICLVLFCLASYLEYRRLRLNAKDDERRRAADAKYLAIMDLHDKQYLQNVARMQALVGMLEMLIEEQKRYTYQAARRAASPEPTLTPAAMDAHRAAFDAAGVYHERQGVPRAGSEFPWGPKVMRPEMAARVYASSHYDDADEAAARRRASDAAWMDAQLTGVGAYRVDSTGAAEHIPAAAFMGGGGGSFDGGGASGDYDRGTSSSSTTASDSCSSSSASTSSDSSSFSCSSSDSGGGSSGSSD